MTVLDALLDRPVHRSLPASVDLAIALIGPGRVGQRLMDRLRRDAPGEWALDAVLNSTEARLAIDPDGSLAGDSFPSAAWSCDDKALKTVSQNSTNVLERLPEILRQRTAFAHVIVDTTASDAIAARHAQWLDNGILVVTANKLALGSKSTALAGLEQALDHAAHPACYGTSATVGAGLPVLDSITRLRRAGESIKRIRAVVSGSLSFFCGRVSANQSPSESVIEAHERGLTEPDPRIDLSGTDVARKLMILAQRSGIRLDQRGVVTQKLIPESLTELGLPAFFDQVRQLDQFCRDCFQAAPGQGEQVVYQAELSAAGQAKVGLRRVAGSDPMAQLRGVDNRIEIYTDTYDESPLVIAGPGAGADVTALALWSDLQRISDLNNHRFEQSADSRDLTAEVK